MRIHLLAYVLVALAVGVVGCLGDVDPGEAPASEANDSDEGSTPGFLAPVQLDGSGFEPSIEVGPQGTIYVTAPSPAENTSRTPSWLWLSRDGGQTWTAPAEHPVAPPADAEVGMEGDIAVDPRGWLYQLDTYYEDNTVGAWSDQGRVLEHARSAQGTPTRDDRPWIAAVGDGELVYLGNHMSTTGPEGVYRSPSRWIYRSLDGGRTWAPVTGVPEDPDHGFHRATLDAHPASGTVVVAQLTGDEPPAEVRVLVSEDGGRTFDDPRTVAEIETARGPQVWPSVAVGSEAIHVAWTERTGEGSLSPSQVQLARSRDGGETWDVDSLGDGERTFAYPWIAVGPSGQLGLSVYAADVPLGRDTDWTILAGVEPDLAEDGFVPELSRADPEPVSDTQNPDETLRDFHQNAFGPDGRLHIAYMVHRDGEPWIRWTATTP